MEKKTIATTISGILILALIISIGATLSAFKVSKEKVEVKSIVVKADTGISITDKDGKQLESLKINSSSIGVRPATGEEDNKTQVPSTINDNIGTEGAYALFYISTDRPWCIVLNSCSLTAGEDENLDNVRMALLDKKSEAVKGDEIGKTLGCGEGCQDKEITVAVWLDADAKKSIASADIHIELGVIYN